MINKVIMGAKLGKIGLYKKGGHLRPAPENLDVLKPGLRVDYLDEIDIEFFRAQFYTIVFETDSGGFID
jgi:hypothetical protein